MHHSGDNSPASFSEINFLLASKASFRSMSSKGVLNKNFCIKGDVPILKPHASIIELIKRASAAEIFSVFDNFFKTEVNFVYKDMKRCHNACRTLLLLSSSLLNIYESVAFASRTAGPRVMIISDFKETSCTQSMSRSNDRSPAAREAAPRHRARRPRAW